MWCCFVGEHQWRHIFRCRFRHVHTTGFSADWSKYRNAVLGRRWHQNKWRTNLLSPDDRWRTCCLLLFTRHRFFCILKKKLWQVNSKKCAYNMPQWDEYRSRIRFVRQSHKFHINIRPILICQRFKNSIVCVFNCDCTLLQSIVTSVVTQIFM